MKHIISIILILFIIIQLNNVAALTSCEGFIKSNTKIDYAKIQAKLFTAQGNLKHEAECNPRNGYFFIPIYNKGKYLIKLSTPEGWIFAPELHEVEIVNDDECPGELNFELTGFQIKGTIQNGQNSQFELGLYQENGNHLIEKTKCDENGDYIFIAKPGKYIISPIRGSEHCVAQGSIKIEIIDGPVRVKPNIRVAGQNLKVQLNNEKGNPLSGATAILSSDKQIKFENLPINSERPLASSRDQKWFYFSKTDSTSSAMFYCIPFGKYSIYGEFKRSNMEAHFEQKQIEMNSKTPKVIISINAFTLFGTVFLRQKKKPISGVKIYIDGISNNLESDVNGKFKLEKISPGKHKIMAEMENYEFTNVQINAGIEMEKEISITPNKMAIAGNVISTEQGELPISLELIKLDSDVEYKIQTGKDGKFYGMFEPGKYSLKPLSSQIPFSPNQIGINLLDGPVEGIKFIQYKARVGGNVQCFSGKCHQIGLELWQNYGNGILNAKQDVQLNGQFLFDGILPGKYKVKIVDQENILWDASEKQIEIMDKDLEGIKFEQKGYWLNIHTTHPVKMKYWPVKSPTAEKEISLSKGQNQIKFTEAGKFGYSLNSCYEFEINGMEEKNAFGVPSTSEIKLTATSFSISVIVELDKDDSSLQILIREKDNELMEPLSQRGQFKNGRIAFEFHLAAQKISRTMEIHPKSNQLLFSPDSISFVFDGKCHPEFVKIKSQIGQFIEGKVEPKMEGAKVEATHRKNEQIALITETDAQGKYKIGPVWDISDYSLEMSKDGYKFEKTTLHNFGSIQLSQLHIHFVDAVSRDALAEVLVSISGGTEFRSKNMTDQSGILRFIGLAPGPYYIRPILQEYKFNSSSFQVEIVEGQTQQLVLEAKRFAYSIFGKVSSIGSRPFRIPICIEAISMECENHQEEALLNPKNDEYRIRGLKPECTYKITLNDADSSKQIKAFPPIMNIKMEMEDKTNINFVLLPIERPDPVAVGELLFTAGGIQQSAGGFKVQLLEADNQQIIQEQLLNGLSTVFFFNLPAYNRVYTIKVIRINAAKQPKNTAAVSATFFANSQFNYIRLEPRPEQKASDIEVLKANYFGLALILLITLAFLNQAKTKSLFEYGMNVLRELIDRRNGGHFMGMASGTDDPQKRKKPRKM